MRIGLFTDSYHPSTNGITAVVDIIRSNLQKLGHDVYIVAPAPTLRLWRLKREKNVIRIPAIRGLFFDEHLTTVFFPPREYRKLSALKFDAIVVFTPAQVGLMGAYTALRDDTPLISQYSTSLTDYIEKYPAVMPGVLALSAALPLALRVKPKEILHFGRIYSTKNQDQNHTWRQHYGKNILTFFHNRCDAVIAVSPKIADVLNEWGTLSPVHTIPTGVDKGKVSDSAVSKFRHKHSITNDDLVLLSLGRVAQEKNLDLLLDSMPLILKKQPNAKLVVVGGFSYREVLEKKAEAMGLLGDRVVFTGPVPMAERWNAFASGDIFCFPSLTDTQALVLNEAALTGLPIVWCDTDVNQVLVDKKTGLHADNNPRSYANAILKLCASQKLRKEYGRNACQLAKNFSEAKQTKKLLSVITKLK